MVPAEQHHRPDSEVGQSHQDIEANGQTLMTVTGELDTVGSAG